MNLSDSDFTIRLQAQTIVHVFIVNSQHEVEAFFEGAQNVFKGADVNFSNKKIVLERNWYCQ